MTTAAGSPRDGGGERRLFVLLGEPLDHSLSPALHGAAFRALGIPAAYHRVRAAAGEVGPLMRSVARAGGGGNVTLPAKGAAAAALDAAGAAVRATGACNCFWGEGGELAGDNTDVEGFRRAVAGLVPGGTEEGLAGRRVLLLGAGGGARAVLRGCLEEGAASVDLLNRTVGRAEAAAREVAGGDGRVSVLEDRAGLASRYDLVVNATSLGLAADDPLPLDLSELEAGAAFDLVYGEEGTAWTRHARRLGVPARDGLEMLLRQAAASLRRWLGVEPPLEAMRRAAASAGGGGASRPG